jgi:hypothetical protein
MDVCGLFVMRMRFFCIRNSANGVGHKGDAMKKPKARRGKEDEWEEKGVKKEQKRHLRKWRQEKVKARSML